MLLGRQHGPSYGEGVFIATGVVYRLLHSEPGGEENGEGQQHVDRDQNSTESGFVVLSHGVHLDQQRQKVAQKDHHTALLLDRQRE